MKRTFQFCAMAVVLALFLWYISRNIRGMRWHDIHWKPVALLLSVLFVQCGYLINIAVIRKTMKLLNTDINFRESFVMYFISNLGRYVPGRVWQMMAMTYFAKRKGVAFRESGSLFIVNQAIIILVGLVFAFSFILGQSHQTDISERIPYLIFLPLFVILIFPNSIVHALNRILRILKRAPIRFRISYGYILTLLGSYWLSYLCTGLSFICLVRGIGLPVSNPIYMLAVYPLAYILGYVALVTPGGIGIRESAILYLLKPYYSVELCSLIALTAFVWITVVEAINTALALYLHAMHKRGVYSVGE